MTSVFSQHISDTLEKDQPKVSPPTELGHSQIGKLLTWLLFRWKKPTINIFEICNFGPRPRNKWKEAEILAQELAKSGWLVPAEDRKSWMVIRKTGNRQPTHKNSHHFLAPPHVNQY
jgi:hypothetical protein